MPLIRIQLDRTWWEYDPAEPLGKAGGFGAVYAGRGEDGRSVAVKRLHADQLGVTSREIEVAKFLLGHDHPHVIGIFDVGRDPSTDAIFLVMERALQSLQKLVKESAPIALTDALEIIDAIAAGLEEIGELVHRDLKPDNVLLHNGVWKLADLGLARFIEEATASNTMSRFFTLPYCAPEQCRMERPTKATDVYAVGAILYALLTGQPPFPGPAREDYLHQHQFEKPPILTAPPAIQELGLDCLAKNPLTRPTLESLRNRVRKVRTSLGVAPSGSPLSMAAATIAAAAATVAEKRASQEAEALLAVKASKDREATSREAAEKLKQSLTFLADSIKDEAPTAEVAYGEAVHGLQYSSFAHQDLGPHIKINSAHVVLGSATLEWMINGGHFPRLKDTAIRWDVLAVAYIGVTLNKWLDVTSARSANLLFGKLGDDEGYRWWEVSLAPAPESANCDPSCRRCPFALIDRVDFWRDEEQQSSRDYDQLLLGKMRTNVNRAVLSADPSPIDGEYEDVFFGRWKQWLANAAVFGLGPAESPSSEQGQSPFHPPPPLAPVTRKFFPYPDYDTGIREWH